ncbi:MAG: hypothetical protein LBU73_07580 [Helicobacteraceae bacterium]|jgi:hypothetical protein|nr:hypothetical protein [Helicobacteraceae bacterium]
MAKSHEELFLKRLQKNETEAAEKSPAALSLPEAAFAISADYKLFDHLIYHNTLQAYEEMIADAVENARNSYYARCAAAKFLAEKGVVINHETIAGVVNGSIAHIKAQAELYVWTRVMNAPLALSVVNNEELLTTIPLAAFVILHFKDESLKLDEKEYLLVKKSKDDGNRSEFDGNYLIAGSVSASAVSGEDS